MKSTYWIALCLVMVSALPALVLPLLGGSAAEVLLPTPARYLLGFGVLLFVTGLMTELLVKDLYVQYFPVKLQKWVYGGSGVAVILFVIGLTGLVLYFR